MSLSARVADARMDPWCLVLLTTGEAILFGFADQHPTTGGLSWMCSSPVRKIDLVAGRARTESGRLYLLGQRMGQEAIPAEGQEAWLAYDLLVGGDAENEDAVPRISADRNMDGEWLTACKMARHLGLTPPDRVPAQVSEFLMRHMRAYIALRGKYA